MSPELSPTLSFLDISGTPYEVGCALGRFGAYATHEHLKHTPAWRSVTEHRGTPMVAAMMGLVRDRFDRYWAELQGLAEGLELPFEDVFLWNCRGDIWAMATEGCTTVQIPGVVHKIAHNEDGDPGLRGHCALARLSSAGGNAFTTFVYPASLPGHTLTVTEVGLVQTVNNVRPLDGIAGIPRMVLTRAILDAPSLDAALSLLQAADRAGGFHLTLAQAGDPRLLSVEFTATACSVREITAPAVHANHLVHEAMSNIAQIVTESSESRQRRGNGLLAALDPDDDEADGRSLLWDVEEGALPIFRAAPADPDNENTLATGVFQIGANGVEWRVYDKPWALARLSGYLVLGSAAVV